MQKSIEKLLKGVFEFKEKDFEKLRDIYIELKDKQKPHTLFIGCSDSRVIPNLITKTLPGELFIIRNVANIVPPYRIAKDYAGTTAAIEYAVNILEVENIIVCGHSNCGGCNTLLNGIKKLDNLPNIREWLKISEPILNELKNIEIHHTEYLQLFVEQNNIVHQIKNLLTYPYIKKKVLDKKLQIFGWHYIIQTGDIFTFNFEKQKFEPLTQ
ncbi:carbonic anhydrase [Deferribacter desulfuricans SSM1]|uniref:Carbonic anhydrase n=1 Tax=Deferribacter desulfuricans (strain DSM 14783 / JCM 11476 / NBRC 101012 / SSM1) TaxID=639282 RepID=D3P9J7_DEFDS|nr:carbonic anhydrase [Deferribacter desulfuricans]BAI81387.1 carbonic anhydrase [Deferribacter desulfuricans SSM1]